MSPPTIGNNGYQATGANRFTYLTNQIGGKAALKCPSTSALYNLLANIVTSGPFTIYAVFNWPSNAGNFAACGNGSSSFTTAVLTSSRSQFTNDAGTTHFLNSIGSSGSVACRWRLDASTLGHFAMTGLAEGSFNGNTASPFTFSDIFKGEAQGIDSGITVAYLSIQLADTVTTGQDTAIRTRISQQYALTIP